MPTRLMFNMFSGENKQADLLKGHPCFTVKGGTNVWIETLHVQLNIFDTPDPTHD